MNNLHHPNLLSLLAFLETGSNYYMVLPFCKDGDLEKKVQKSGMIPESEAIFYLKQIMSGFVYLYKNKIMHRDFKLANVFLDGDQVIIGDFGFSKQGVDVTTTKLGTPFNMAPEIMFSTGRSCYTSKADLWAIGVAYYHMLYGRQPFDANSMSELQHLIVKCSGPNVRFLPEVNVSNESKNLMRSLLEFDPNKRMNWQQFFNHSVFEVHSPKANQQGQYQENYFNTGLYGQAGYTPTPTNRDSVQHSPSNQYQHQASYQQQTLASGGQNYYGHPQTQTSPLPAGLVITQPGVQAASVSRQASQHRNFTAFVENHFIEEKKVVNDDAVFSSDFEIPLPSMDNLVPPEGSMQKIISGGVNMLQPLNIQGSFGSRTPQSSGNRGSIQGTLTTSPGRDVGGFSGNGFQTANSNEYLTHERNKYLFVLQASKQWKEIAKLKEVEQKRAIMMILSLALCKKGMVMNETLQINIESRHDKYNIPGFGDFCGSQTGQKLYAALQEDQKSSVQFLNYLETKVNEYNQTNPLDPNLVTAVRAAHSTEGSLDISIEKMLIHILHWMGGIVNKTLLNACATTHYALNTSVEFQNSKNFDWKGFTAKLDASDVSECMHIVRKYYNRLDEISSGHGEVHSQNTGQGQYQGHQGYGYGQGGILQQRLFQ